VPSESDHLFPESQQSGIFLLILPVQPGNFIILTVGIVISLLGITEFVSHEDQRRGLGQ